MQILENNQKLNTKKYFDMLDDEHVQCKTLHDAN